MKPKFFCVLNHAFKKILIIRFSAMGDVVLTVPVIKSLLRRYPDLEITVLTKPFFQTFFENIPQVKCFSNDLKGKNKGVLGLYKLVNEIVKNQEIEAVFDLHSVLRTWILDLFFKLRGVPVFLIDKGRKEKKEFIKKKRKNLLKHTTLRYQEVFLNAGFKFDLVQENLDTIQSSIANDTRKKIGIAPFAAHQSKMWGISRIYELIEKINKEQKNIQFYLFGGGKSEVEALELMANYYDNVINLAGKLSLKEEIQKMAEMSVFLSMDSGNMHIATLTGVPVVSVWGGTDPNIGFSALYQPKENHIALSQDQITCRPCSVFGTSNCLNTKKFACMEDLEVDKVIERLTYLLDRG